VDSETKIEFLNVAESKSVFEDVMKHYKVPTVDANVMMKLQETFDETNLSSDDGYWKFLRVVQAIAEEQGLVMSCVLKAILNL
jgi:hypothetical protein